VYGPFVADTAHAVLAEIHPVQMYWWSERATPRSGCFDPKGPYALFVIQDASNRYTQPHHFVLSKAPPEGSTWEPWAGAPVEAVFEIPFWADAGKSVHFTLTPYEYEGQTVGSPETGPCKDTVFEVGPESVSPAGPTDTESSSPGGLPTERDPPTISVCNATGTDRSSAIDVSIARICQCASSPATADADDGDEDEKDGVSCPRTGFLGKITLRMRTGRAREWREGSLGVLLKDSRAEERRAAVVQGAAELKLARKALSRPDPTLRMTWRSPPGEYAWHDVSPGEADLAAAETAITQLFRAAGWPPEVAWPATSLRRLGRVDVAAEVLVPNLRDRDEGSVDIVNADFGTPLARPLDGGSPGRVDVEELSETARRLSFERVSHDGSSIRPYRVDVDLKVKVSYPSFEARQVVEVQKGGETKTKSKLKSTWTLWTHGLGAHPDALWLHTTRRLCDHNARRTPDLDVDPLVYENVRIATRRVLKDKVVSVAELMLLVNDVARICGALDSGEATARKDRDAGQSSCGVS
jgi:hypothetical protein